MRGAAFRGVSKRTIQAIEIGFHPCHSPPLRLLDEVSIGQIGRDAAYCRTLQRSRLGAAIKQISVRQNPCKARISGSLPLNLQTGYCGAALMSKMFGQVQEKVEVGTRHQARSLSHQPFR
jgi:hypothetical protein